MTPRERHLLRTYGITLSQYNTLLSSQRGCCAICKRKAELFRTSLCVDHDHKTGEIRGLLCTFCNRRVIGRHRDPEIFLASYHYLSQGTGWFVPPKKKKRKKKRVNR